MLLRQILALSDRVHPGLDVLYGGLSCFQYSRFFALIYKGKRVIRHETNLNDTESALLPEGMKKSVCVFMLVENGVAL